MIAHVLVGPGTAIKDSRRRVVQKGLEIFLGKIPQGCDDIAERAIGHHMGKKQLHILQGVIGRLEPHYSFSHRSQIAVIRFGSAQSRVGLDIQNTNTSTPFALSARSKVTSLRPATEAKARR